MGQCNKMLEEMSFNALFQKLPVGIEVYDGRGQLVDLNRTDENLFAISRKDIMGINLFENPNFPEDKIARLITPFYSLPFKIMSLLNAVLFLYAVLAFLSLKPE